MQLIPTKWADIKGHADRYRKWARTTPILSRIAYRAMGRDVGRNIGEYGCEDAQFLQDAGELCSFKFVLWE